LFVMERRLVDLIQRTDRIVKRMNHLSASLDTIDVKFIHTRFLVRHPMLLSYDPRKQGRDYGRRY
jgi:hypothetical protein